MSFTKTDYQNICCLLKNNDLTQFVSTLKTKPNVCKYVYIDDKHYLEDINCIMFKFDNVNPMDVLNTIAMMRSETYCNFRKWKITSRSMGVYLTLPYDDFRRVQKGFCTELMMMHQMSNYHKIRHYNKNPVVPWVLRCLGDLDDVIYVKGIKCLYHALTGCHMKEKVDYMDICRWRGLGHLLSTFDWKKKAFEDDNFVKSLICFLTPGDQTLTTHIETINKMKEKGLECFKSWRKWKGQTNTTIKASSFQINCFYQWLATQKDVFSIFCDIHNQKNIKIQKKRKKTPLNKNTIYDENIMMMYQNVSCQGERQRISLEKKKNDYSLLDIVYFVFMKDNRTIWQEYTHDLTYRIMVSIIENGVLSSFSPVATLPRTSEDSHKGYRQMDVFPIVMLQKEIKDKINELNINI